MSMTAKEASAARDRLGLSIEDLSADLALTPDVVRGWETGTVRVPARVARELQWRLAVKVRHEALAGSGLPECAWMDAWDEEEFPEGMKAQTAHMERAAEHLTSCSVCKAREQFVVERFGEMPRSPMSGWMAGLDWVASRVEKLPEWGRPGVWAGLAFGGYSVLRIIVFMPAILREPRLAVTALTGLSASMAIGASLGLVYGAFRAARTNWAKRVT